MMTLKKQERAKFFCCDGCGRECAIDVAVMRKTSAMGPSFRRITRVGRYCGLACLREAHPVQKR
jgi:hypothetical protein